MGEFSSLEGVALSEVLVVQGTISVAVTYALVQIF
jgi:hypothetical protein